MMMNSQELDFILIPASLNPAEGETEDQLTMTSSYSLGMFFKGFQDYRRSRTGEFSSPPLLPGARRSLRCKLGRKLMNLRGFVKNNPFRELHCGFPMVDFGVPGLVPNPAIRQTETNLV